MSNYHTPAPWEIESAEFSKKGGYTISPPVAASDAWAANGEELIAVTHGTQCEANASLIAAAPELLEALEVANRLLDKIEASNCKLYQEDLKLIKEAINKARGES